MHHFGPLRLHLAHVDLFHHARHSVDDRNLRGLDQLNLLRPHTNGRSRRASRAPLPADLRTSHDPEQQQAPLESELRESHAPEPPRRSRPPAAYTAQTLPRRRLFGSPARPPPPEHHRFANPAPGAPHRAPAPADPAALVIRSLCLHPSFRQASSPAPAQRLPARVQRASHAPHHRTGKQSGSALPYGPSRPHRLKSRRPSFAAVTLRRKQSSLNVFGGSRPQRRSGTLNRCVLFGSIPASTNAYVCKVPRARVRVAHKTCELAFKSNRLEQRPTAPLCLP